jgi:hypothetical protein
MFAVFGGTGFLLCLNALVGCWWLHSQVVDRVDRSFGRADTLLVGVGESLDQVGGRMRQTRQELEAIQHREANLAANPPPEPDARRALTRKALSAINPQLGEARSNLVKATEIALVVNGLLDALADLPLVERTSVDTDQLKQTSDRVSVVIGSTDKLVSLLGNSAPEQADSKTSDELSRLVKLVNQITMATDGGSDRVQVARLTVADRQARIKTWITRIAALLTVSLVWIGVGQVSLSLHGRTLIRKK